MNNTQWSKALVASLLGQGYRHFAVSPGSRSTSLTAAIAAHSDAECWMHFDERGSAFRAIGYARATGRALPLVCTSGSAVANYLPAVVEAHNDRVPMLLLTTDRPPELHDCGANQTIDQRKIFGRFADYLELPCSSSELPIELIQSTIALALRRSQLGPVQLNLAYRKPFEPVDSPALVPVITQSIAGTQRLDDAQLDALLPLLEDGILVVGRLENRREQEAAGLLAKKLGWPLFADVLSGLRLGPQGNYTELLLRQPGFRQTVRPRCVLHIGRQFVSMPLLQLLKQLRPQNYIQVAPHADRIDPNHQVTHRVQSDVADFCLRLAGWQAAGAGHDLPMPDLDELLDDYLGSHWGELAAARQLSQTLTDEALYVASSLSIRHIDAYGARNTDLRHIAANRGCSGIDGTIASACGYAQGLHRPCTLLTGDLAFFHDLNSLAMLKDLDVPFRIVMLNNDGGAIFAQLPIRKHEALFTSYFQTPHGLCAEHAAALFGLRYSRVESAEDFDTALGSAQLIEVPCSVEAFETQRLELDQLVASALSTQGVQQ